MNGLIRTQLLGMCMIHVEEQSFFNDNVEGLVLEPGHPPHICPNPSQVWKALALEFDDLPESAERVEDVWRCLEIGRRW